LLLDVIRAVLRQCGQVTRMLKPPQVFFIVTKSRLFLYFGIILVFCLNCVLT
jgi:hypothetical protein